MIKDINILKAREGGGKSWKDPLLTHRNAITTCWKRVGRVFRDNTKARESIMEENLAKNVSLSLHNSFCQNRESKMTRRRDCKSRGSGCDPTNN